MAKKKLTKNLANCTPREFLTQTNKIRKSVHAWLKATDIIGIRKDVPKMKDIPDDADPDEVDRIMDEYQDELKAAGVRNLSRILDEIMDKHPDETLDLIALVNFVEPNDLDNYSVAELLRNITEIMNDDDVIGFFTSLMRLEKLNILDV